MIRVSIELESMIVCFKILKIWFFNRKKHSEKANILAFLIQQEIKKIIIISISHKKKKLKKQTL